MLPCNEIQYIIAHSRSSENAVRCSCINIFFILFKVILIENKEESLVRAQSRSAELGLKNIGFIQANLDYFTGPFHIGVSRASDTIQKKYLYSLWQSIDSVDNMATIPADLTI